MPRKPARKRVPIYTGKKKGLGAEVVIGKKCYKVVKGLELMDCGQGHAASTQKKMERKKAARKLITDANAAKRKADTAKRRADKQVANAQEKVRKAQAKLRELQGPSNVNAYRFR
jgi:uncharacterized protein YPO0396